jgi:hypothetical protein
LMGGFCAKQMCVNKNKKVTTVNNLRLIIKLKLKLEIWWLQLFY